MVWTLYYPTKVTNATSIFYYLDTLFKPKSNSGVSITALHWGMITMECLMGRFVTAETIGQITKTRRQNLIAKLYVTGTQVPSVAGLETRLISIK